MQTGNKFYFINKKNKYFYLNPKNLFYCHKNNKLILYKIKQLNSKKNFYNLSIEINNKIVH